MKFTLSAAKRKNISDKIVLDEYCDASFNLPIDGAYAKINGPYVSKINKTFTELFFVISGKLNIEMNANIYSVEAKDIFIVPINTKHKILDSCCEVFISCTPQFRFDGIEFCE